MLESVAEIRTMSLIVIPKFEKKKTNKPLFQYIYKVPKRTRQRKKDYIHNPSK